MKHTTFRLKPGMSLFACAACALGLLLWARLLLVSHPPRVATADPVPVAVRVEKPAATTPRVAPAQDERDGKITDRQAPVIDRAD